MRFILYIIENGIYYNIIIYAILFINRWIYLSLLIPIREPRVWKSVTFGLAPSRFLAFA